jgi:hypothetical protein
MPSLFRTGYQDDLDRALAVLAGLASLDSEPRVHESHEGQVVVRIDEHVVDILVWASPWYTTDEQELFLERLVQNSGSALPLLVVGAGNGGRGANGMIKPTRQTNISEVPVEDDIAAEAPLRPVYWLNLEEVFEVFRTGLTEAEILRRVQQLILSSSIEAAG